MKNDKKVFFRSLLWGILILAAIISAACSNDNNGGMNENNDPVDATVETDGTIEKDAGFQEDAEVGDDAEVEDDGDIDEPGEATVLTVNIHDASQWSLFMDTMTVSEGAGSGYHLLVTRNSGPFITLGTEVNGVNMGNEQGYHDITEAPEEGYVGDDPEPLIGWGWKAGGSGSSGFDMTENVYVLALPDNTYAKVEVISANQGIVDILCYRQEDGSLDITTAP
jgi:hypothetical protein